MNEQEKIHEYSFDITYLDTMSHNKAIRKISSHAIRYRHTFFLK